MTYYDAYVGRLDDPNFHWDGGDWNGNVPHRLSPFFPPTIEPVYWEVLRRIVLNQAFRKIYPALSSQIIIVMLGSAVVSQISAEDLTYAANFVASRNFRNFEVYLLVALAYLLLAMLMRAALRALGRVIFKAR